MGEIFIAAFAGLAIQFTKRNSYEHLMGAGRRSCRSARCGNPNLPENEDEKMIRKAIARVPVLSHRSLSLLTSMHLFMWGSSMLASGLLAPVLPYAIFRRSCLVGVVMGCP